MNFYLPLHDESRISVSELIQTISAMFPKRGIKGIYYQSSDPAIYIFLSIRSDGNSNAQFVADGPHRLRVHLSPVALDLRLLVRLTEMQDQSIHLKNQCYFAGIILTHTPAGSPRREIAKYVTPVFRGGKLHRTQTIVIEDGGCSLDFSAIPGTSGILEFALQLWEEDSKEAATQHAKSKYESEDIRDTYLPLLQTHEGALNSAVAQPVAAFDGAGDAVAGVPVFGAAGSSALKGTGQIWGVGAKIHEAVRLPDLKGLDKITLRYTFDGDQFEWWKVRHDEGFDLPPQLDEDTREFTKPDRLNPISHLAGVLPRYIDLQLRTHHRIFSAKVDIVQQ